MLAFAWLPLAWMVFEWRCTARRSALILKALSFVAILLALAEPRLNVTESAVAVAVLVASASVSDADLERASQIVGGDHWRSRAPLDARDPLRPGATRALDQQRRTEGVMEVSARPPGEGAGRGTDLEGAIQDARGIAAGGMPVLRVALGFQDGKQNKWQRGASRVAGATAGHSDRHVRAEGAPGAGAAAGINQFADARAFTGEQFPIDAVVSTPKAGPAEVEFMAEGRSRWGKTAG